MKNVDQAFLARVFSLILQKSCFWLINSIVLKLGPNKFRVQTIFYFPLQWQAKPRIIIITFINFRTLKAICVWTTTRINVKLSGHLQGIKIYSQKHCFVMTIICAKSRSATSQHWSAVSVRKLHTWFDLSSLIFLFWNDLYKDLINSADFKL